MFYRKATNRQATLVLAAGVLAITASAALWTNSPDEATGGEVDKGAVNSAAPLQPLFDQTEPATNRADLNLVVDERKVLGWISGKQDRSGAVVKIAFGKRFETVVVQRDNTFTWSYQVKEPTDVKFTIGEMTKTTHIDPVKTSEPSVFFVVDRTAYRPGQTIHFAGFLRLPGHDGEFAPLADKDVEVRLVSRSKKTTAAKLKLKSDVFGRISGEYSFSPADALDTYDLSIPGYKGSAELKLAEFRKAKVKLKIDGKLEGQNLRLTFRALDFLDKPVPGSNVHYKLQVVQQTGDQGAHALDADEFVYREDDAFNLVFDKRLTDDHRLLRDAGIPVTAFGGRRTTKFVAQREGDVVMGEQGEVEQTIPLEPSWTSGDYRMVVQGVLLDYNGREQRAVQSISIGKKTKNCDLELSLLNRFVQAGSDFKINVEAKDVWGVPTKAAATIVAMRLEPDHAAMYRGYGYGSYGYYGYYGYRNIYSQQILSNRLLSGLRHSRAGRPLLNWQRALSGTNETVRRKAVTAVAVTDGVATLQLSDPGPYKLVCYAQLPNGNKLQNEIGCIVREKETMPGLILQLDRSELQTGDMLRGSIHSRFRDARALLTIRDSGGIRFWKSIDLSNGIYRLNQRLPEGLRYGCHVDVQYLDDERLHMAGRFIRVEPVDRMVKVDVKHEELYRPGDDVTLNLSVNRKEPVDLVVSVYDQSLLGIAADRSKDVRNFYLADERVRYSVTQEKLRRMLAGVTVRELIERAEKLLKDDPELAKSNDGNQLRQMIGYYRGSNVLYAHALHLLFQLAGIDARPDMAVVNNYGWNWRVRFNKQRETMAPLRLLEVIGQGHSDAQEWKLNLSFAGETLTYFCYHESHRNQLLQLGQMPGGMLFRGGYGQMSARGDARFSVTGNGFFSQGVSGNAAISGQAFISHMPTAGAPAELISTDDPGVSVRRDFSDSAFWNARVRTDDQGQAKVTFKLPDSLTNWRVVVTAISKKMHVGQVSKSFRTYKPVMIWPMLPRVFTEGDTVELYGSVHNRTKQSQQMEVSLKVENGKVLSPAKVRIEVPADSQVPVYWTFQPEKEGFTQLLMTAKCPAGSDASLKRLPVSRLAAEQLVTASGLCRDTATIVVPSDVVLANSQMELTLVPSLADDMVESLDYLVQYPYGCVEQTMSRFLPAIRVAQTLERANIKRPELEKKLPRVVAAGIKRLLELQRPDGGWGWQGGSRTHEMMTPYALYGLLQAEKAGYDIPNEQAVKRGITRLQQFINAMNEKQAADRIYCMYVYSHRKDMSDEWLTFIKQQAENNNLSDYALALSLEILIDSKADQKTIDMFVSALQKRAERIDGAAFWKTANFSRWGNDRFEITAAVLKALVAYNPDHELVPEILSFFTQTKRGNRWNSTKDTAMIIYAMCDYLAAQGVEPGAEQSLLLTVNSGQRHEFKLTSGKVAKLVIPGAELKHGANEIRFLRFAQATMFRAVVRFWQKGKDIEAMEHGLQVVRRFYLLNAKGAKVRELKDGETIPRGSYIESVVGVKHKLGARMQYVLVANPKPASSEILPVTDTRYNQTSTGFALREDKTRGVAWHHEQTGAHINDRCVLHVELAGDYTVPPAEVELMYDTQVRGHSASFRLRVEDSERVAARD